MGKIILPGSVSSSSRIAVTVTKSVTACSSLSDPTSILGHVAAEIGWLFVRFGAEVPVISARGYP